MAKSIIGDIVALGDGFGGTGTATDPISVDSSEINTSDLNNDAGYITGVTHDSTITGDGSSDASKLSVKEMVGAQDYRYGGSVKIGSNMYPFVRIGNQLWTTVSLHEEIGSLGTDYRYSTDEGSRGGFLYATSSLLTDVNTYTDEFQSILPTGWRIPRISDFNTLISNSSNALDYISTSYGGTNALGFDAVLLGYRYNKSSSVTEYDATSFFTSSEKQPSGNSLWYRLEFRKNGAITYEENCWGYNMHEVRLVMDYIDGSGEDGCGGIVPPPSKTNINHFLRGDGTWSAVNVPSKTSDLTNDSGFIDSGDITEITSSQIDSLDWSTPVVLPPNTLRIQWDAPADEWSMSGKDVMDMVVDAGKGSYTVVDESKYIYDWTYNNSNWSYVFNGLGDYQAPGYKVIAAGDTSAVTNTVAMFSSGPLRSVCWMDLRNVTIMSSMFATSSISCVLPDFDFDSAESVDGMFSYVTSALGVVELYNKMSAATTIQSHEGTFEMCGSTEEQAQIPVSWGGTKEEG